MTAHENPGSSDAAQATSNAGEQKARSPVERVIVWGVIGVGALLIATEGWPRLRYTLDFTSLDNAVVDVDENTNHGVVESEAQKLVTRYSTHSVRKNLPSNELASPREDKYTYNGLISERVFYVYYGHVRADEEPEVLAVRTEPVEYVQVTMPDEGLQPTELDTSPIEAPSE